MVHVEGGFIDVRETEWTDSSALALFASRFYDKKKIDFNLPAERKKKRKKERKTADEENGLEPWRVLTLHLDPRFTRYSSAPLKPSRFRSISF